MKKTLSMLMIALISIAALGCDFLSTIYAVKDFSVEYRTYNEIYATAEQSTIDATTEITVVETNIEGLESVSSHIYAMFDKTASRTYMDETRDDVQTVSVFQNVDGLIVEYLIEDTVVTPRIPEAGSGTSEGIFNMDEQFSFQDLDQERKTGEHSYAFNLPLKNLVNLDKVLDMVDELKAFDPDSTSLDAAIAQVEISFETVESVIDVTATLTDQRLDFADGVYAILTITNHTTVRIPELFEFPDVFADTFSFVPPSDVRLATKPFLPDVAITVPLTTEGGWIRLALTAGVYTIEADAWGAFAEAVLQDAAATVVPYDAVGSIQVTIAADGNYFLHLVPTEAGNATFTFVKQVPAE